MGHGYLVDDKAEHRVLFLVFWAWNPLPLMITSQSPFQQLLDRVQMVSFECHRLALKAVLLALTMAGICHGGIAPDEHTLYY